MLVDGHIRWPLTFQRGEEGLTHWPGCREVGSRGREARRRDRTTFLIDGRMVS